MKFYTSVQQAGNTILVRGYDHGRQFSDRVKFNPTLFLPTEKPSEWKTLDGKRVRPVKQGTIKDARQFVDTHKEMEDFLCMVRHDTTTSTSLRSILGMR